MIAERLTPEEQAEALAVLEAARAFRLELLARRGGKLFSSSAEVLNEVRDQRSVNLS